MSPRMKKHLLEYVYLLSDLGNARVIIEAVLLIETITPNILVIKKWRQSIRNCEAYNNFISFESDHKVVLSN